MEPSKFNSGRVNNERQYDRVFRSHVEVITEHISKLYVFAWSPTATPRSWKTSLLNAGFALRRLYWGTGAARIRWSAAAMKEVLLDEGLEMANHTAAAFFSCLQTFEGYETAYEDNLNALQRLAELAQPNIEAFMTSLSQLLALPGKEIDPQGLNQAINSHFSPEKTKVLPPEEALRLRPAP